MYKDGFNRTFSSTYFVVLVGFGAFFMVNLFFAVMWEQFSSIADIQGKVRDSGHPCRLCDGYDSLVRPVDAARVLSAEQVVPLFRCTCLSGGRRPRRMYQGVTQYQ